MTGIAWIILDVVLALTAAVGTVKVSTTPPPTPLTEEQLAGPEQKQRDIEKSAAAQPSVQRLKRHKDALPERASLDDLWRSTLFLPTRAEAEPGDTDAEAAAQAAILAGQNFEFELIGIAQISPAGCNPVPIAVLRSKQAGGQRNDRRQPQNRRNPRDNRPDQKQQPAEKKPPEKLIFKEGDPLNNTGYLLKAIYPDQKMVEVSRGSEVVRLYINYAGEAATQRRAEATQAAAEKKKRAEEAQRQNQGNPGRPPMPPGMNNGQQGGPGNNRFRNGGQPWQRPGQNGGNNGGQPWQRSGQNGGQRNFGNFGNNNGR